MSILGKWLKTEEADVATKEEEYYKLTSVEALKENEGSSKMVLLEPRAFSESQQIADHLKSRDAVVINLKRVTSEQAKRIVDFVSGTIYAIGGNLQKIGTGIFLCTPNNVNVLGNITDEKKDKKEKDEDIEM